MTDLERLWDDLPAGPAPVADVLRDGRRAVAVRRRRLVLRPALTGGVVLALAAAFVAGTRTADHGSGPTAVPTHPGGAAPSPVAFQADLPAARSCEQLRRSYVDRALGLVTAWGWDGGVGRFPAGYLGDLSASPQSSTPVAGSVASKTVRQTAGDTGTNVQEAGVDEPDSVKTDGRLLVRLRDGSLVVDDVSGTSVRELAALDLPRLADAELLLAGDTVVAIGTDTTAPNHGSGPRGTRVTTVSLADPATPLITHQVAYSSALVTARQHGDVVRLVLSAGLPDLDFLTPGKDVPRSAALTHNRAAVESSTIEDWLPTYDPGDGSRRLLACTDVAIPPQRLGLDTVSIVGFDADGPTAPVAIGLAGAATTTYASGDDLYLAASPWTACLRCPLIDTLGTPKAPATDLTYLFDFALDGDTATHVASGTVDGVVEDRWSMDSADGTLRVAVGDTDRDNAIVTLRRDGEKLVEAGRLDGLGRGEQIMAVRWFDDLALLVTYRQIDPLYAVDLTDATRPRLLGALKVPGFSSYLHPLGSKRLVGVGSDDRGDAQVGLFDVTDLAHVRRLDTLSFGRGSWALAGDDPRTFTWLPEHRTVLTVVDRRGTGYLAVLKLHAGRFEQRLVEVGRRTGDVRTIGLPDGRVVLVTGREARFLGL